MSTTSPETWPEKVPLRREEPLSQWTTLRVGGPAEFFFEPGRPEDLAAILDRCQAEGISWRMLGGGANVLPPDTGVIRLVFVSLIQRLPRVVGHVRVHEVEVEKVGLVA